MSPLFRKCGIIDGLILTVSAMNTLAIVPSQIDCLKSEQMIVSKVNIGDVLLSYYVQLDR